MTLQQLEYIIAVDRLRHFTKAAEYCRVTQPTLSAMIQKLEEELDTRIFDRSQQPVAPTPIGVHIIQQAREAIVQINRIKNMVEEEKHSLNGTFTLGILPTIAPYLLPRFFPQLSKKYPQLDFRVIEMKTADMKVALTKGDIDAGILASLPGLEDFDIHHIFYEKYYAYISRNSRLFENKIIRVADLANELLWMLDQGHCFRDQFVKFCHFKSAQASQQTYQLGSIETFMRMVEVYKNTSTTDKNESQQELVRPFAIPTPSRQIVMLTAKNYIRHTLLNIIIKEIQGCVNAELLSLKPTQKVI